MTLASLLPVLAVELLAIGLKMQYTHEDIINMRPPPIDTSDPLEITPVREIYYAGTIPQVSEIPFSRDL